MRLFKKKDPYEGMERSYFFGDWFMVGDILTVEAAREYLERFRVVLRDLDGSVYAITLFDYLPGEFLFGFPDLAKMFGSKLDAAKQVLWTFAQKDVTKWKLRHINGKYINTTIHSVEYIDD